MQSLPSLPCVIHIGIHRSGFQQGGLAHHLAAFDLFYLAVSKTTEENIYKAQIPFEHPTGKRSDKKALLKLEMEMKAAGITFEMSEAEDGE
ncbi:hypothetical protein [Prochlorococcus sp. MIT 1303]|uniref:hypothetical protein n=1 Tax=Prochlorococcus sp. MIT 1303 TaxID=1723647 RepID=UPI0007B33A9D|nr:hypothetical protein [Prochlorococcus sp. MIT 1303]KZR64478.1 hypothetical protein PMIT1303_01523 [Prochlorococcus sp. MIT 1303]